MPLILPNLDDRSFEQLRQDALDEIKKNLNADWTDFSEGDPGVTLLEAFAFLTENLLYRLNRLPEKAYIAFLRLMGVTIYPPSAAQVRLQFSITDEAALQAGLGRGGKNGEVFLPRGTQVTAAPAVSTENALVFVTAEDVLLTAENFRDQTVVEVPAAQVELVEESGGVSSGQPGWMIQLQRPPVVAPMNNRLDLAVGVSLLAGELPQINDRQGADGVWYHMWTPVDNLAGFQPGSSNYLVDRQAGVIQFAPAARLQMSTNGNGTQPAVVPLAAIPPAGRQVRIWYPRGGGEAGNVTAGKLTTILRPPGGLQYNGIAVTNVMAARGGLEAESLANALVRGPRDVFSLESLVKTRDYEQAATECSGIAARAKAYAGLALWKHMKPGTVELVLVPTLTSRQPGLDLLDALRAKEDEAALDQVAASLQPRISVGTYLQPVWARYKRVKVAASLIVGDQEDLNAMTTRVSNRLNGLISPLPDSSGPEARLETPGASVRPFLAAALTAPAEASAVLSVDTTSKLAVGQYIIVQNQPCRIVRIQDSQVNVDTQINAGVGAALIASKATTVGTGASDPNTERTLQSGWPFGEQLRVADVYRMLLATENINLISSLKLVLDDAPYQDVRCLAADIFQPSTWFAGSGSRLFRSMDDGKGWELLVAFDRPGNPLYDLDESQDPAAWELRQDSRAELVAAICPSPNQAGLAAVATRINPAPQERSALYVTTDCGEHWYCRFRDMDAVEDMAWLPRGDSLILLLATDQGLFEMDLAQDENGIPSRQGDPMAVPVDPGQPAMPLYAVTVLSGISGHNRVAVAAQARSGVYLSSSADLLPIHDRTSGSAAQASPVDLTIQGEGFFPVRLGDGRTAYTRLGQFQIDAASGQVVTPGGTPLILKDQGKLPPDAANLYIAPNGWVMVLSRSLRVKAGQVLLARFSHPEALEDFGQDLKLETDESGQPQLGLPGETGFGSLQSSSASNFKYLGLRGEDIRRLAVHPLQNNLYLWAASMAIGDFSQGCYRWRFDRVPSLEDAGEWVDPTGWGKAGSCYGLAYQENRILAATHTRGVLIAEQDDSNPGQAPSWVTYKDNNLPHIEVQLSSGNGSGPVVADTLPMRAIASNDQGRSDGASPVVMVGCNKGIYRAGTVLPNEQQQFDLTSLKEFSQLKDAITIPRHWLLVSGEHQIQIYHQSDMGQVVRQPPALPTQTGQGGALETR